jgi:epoxyqueuosine reductase
MVYGCDVCQDVCPWNHAVEKRLAEETPPPDALPGVSLLDWLERDGDELVAEFDRLFVPRKDPRWLRRNALIAAGNAGTGALAPAVRCYLDCEDAMLVETAEWALERIAERAT